MSQHEPKSTAGQSQGVAEERRAEGREACYWQVFVSSPLPAADRDRRWPATLRDLSKAGASLLMGLIGGLFPAIRAARLPIPVALREL